MPLTTSTDSLFDRLKMTSDKSLEGGVERTEGINGSTVEPIYSARKMRCYSVTQSELHQIGLANIGITAFASIGSAMLAFWLDVFKDTLLAESVPAQAQLVVSYIQPAAFALGLIFWLLAGITVVWRRSMISLIKTESVETNASGPDR